MNFPNLVLETIPPVDSSTAASPLHAPYIECLALRYNQNHRAASYTCVLCDRRNLTADAVKYHCDEPGHAANLQRLQDDKDCARAVLDRWQRIHAAPRPLRNAAPAAAASFSRPAGPAGGPHRAARTPVPPRARSDFLHRVDQLGLPAWRDAVQAALFRYAIVAPHHTDGAVDDQLGAAVAMLQRYEHQERLALLELAVWKGGCLSQMPAVAGYHAAQEWLATGWQSEKTMQRQPNAVAIVVGTVRPFLEMPAAVAAVTVTARVFVPGATARPASGDAVAIRRRTSSSAAAAATRRAAAQADLVQALQDQDWNEMIEGEFLQSLYLGR